MIFLLTAVAVLFGTLLLLLSLAGLAFGAFIAADRRTRKPGVFFALWWIPAVAAAGGVLMEDLVTFTVGTFCFVVAGVALAVEHRGSRRPTREKITSSGGVTKKRPLSEEVKLKISERAKRWIFEKAKAR